MGGSFIYTNWLTIELDHVHDFYAIIGVIFAEEFNETISLVHLCNAVFRHVDVNNWAGLNKKFPEKSFGNFVIQAADIDCSILISFGNWTSSHNLAGFIFR